MAESTTADGLHRLVKEALDSGAASSIAEAECLFRGFRVDLVIDEAEAGDPAHQATLLTAVALARRVFLGGVSVSCPPAVALKLPLRLGAELADAVAALGGTVTNAPSGSVRVTIGGGPRPRFAGFHVRTVHAGWRGGIVPGHADIATVGSAAIPLASMLAAALAINEAFLFVRGGNGAAGRRPVGLSLWRPGPDVDWMRHDEDEPSLRYLPARLWLIGLGHLGQAYLWGLSLLPYRGDRAPSLVLQDIDTITGSTESTSILTRADMVGQKKTRAMSAWAERRGFATTIVERVFSADFCRQSHEPAIALCGLDNALGRCALDQVGFDLVVEAGLGRGHRDFQTMRLHVLPGRRCAQEIWSADGVGEEVHLQPGYQKLLAEGALDQCGLTLLAGKAVGAPFVGAVAATLVLSEILRLLHGGVVHQLVDLDLQGIEHRTVVPHVRDFGGFNPGYVDASCQESAEAKAV